MNGRFGYDIRSSFARSLACSVSNQMQKSHVFEIVACQDGKLCRHRQLTNVKASKYGIVRLKRYQKDTR